MSLFVVPKLYWPRGIYLQSQALMAVMNLQILNPVNINYKYVHLDIRPTVVKSQSWQA